MKLFRLLSLGILCINIIFISCKGRNENSNIDPIEDENIIEAPKYDNIRHVSMYLENSGSMFGYVNGATSFVNAVNDLAQYPNLVKDGVNFTYYLISGEKDYEIEEDSLRTYPIGNSAEVFSSKLTVSGFHRPSSGKSDLKNMFEIALKKAKEDSISILVSDGIYDVGGEENPLTALDTEGQNTRSKFIQRLNSDDIETLIIKLESNFRGLYHPSNVTDPMGTSRQINHTRPYYIWIFGNRELLVKYFPENRLEKLMGFLDMARFRKISSHNLPYICIGYKNVGFKLIYKEENIFKLDRNYTDSYEFYLAVDYSKTNLPSNYLTTPENYKSTDGYIVSEIIPIKDPPNIDLKPYLNILEFIPTHIIKVSSETPQPLIGEQIIRLKNILPKWINETNLENDYPLDGNTNQTFGFSTLITGINEAYIEMSDTPYFAQFTINIKK